MAREADGIIVRNALPDDIFDAAPRVKAAVRHGAGVDYIPLQSADRCGVVLTPHIAGMTSRVSRDLGLVAEMRRILNGERPLNPVTFGKAKSSTAQ